MASGTPGARGGLRDGANYGSRPRGAAITASLGIVEISLSGGGRGSTGPGGVAARPSATSRSNGVISGVTGVIARVGTSRATSRPRSVISRRSPFSTRRRRAPRFRRSSARPTCGIRGGSFLVGFDLGFVAAPGGTPASRPRAGGPAPLQDSPSDSPTDSPTEIPVAVIPRPPTARSAPGSSRRSRPGAPHGAASPPCGSGVPPPRRAGRRRTPPGTATRSPCPSVPG